MIFVLFFVCLVYFDYFYTQILCIMQWDKDTLREARISVKLSQPALAEALGVHFRAVQNKGKGAISIPPYVFLALDNLFGTIQGLVSREVCNRVVEALNSATELNRKLTDIINQTFTKTNTPNKCK